ncbi:transmembrane protein 26 [Anopheles darlingi]|uniref:Transmembrane protein 26 n=1 Tax=Anopheles darlingi TaxID=43151 RepID=W5JGE6_ANODA|nr:transmembrane protein 26 [Anopheles darlingi]
MAKLLATFKAVLTRILFAAHGFIAIWQVTQNKTDPIYWSLCAPIGVLCIEGIFTLAIKKTKNGAGKMAPPPTERCKGFCPSVFLYLSSIVPAIWLLELDKLDKRTRYQDQVLNETINLVATVGKDLKDLNKMLGVKIQLPDIQLTAEMWVTLIEQFLMLVLIIGRWMLPKGDLTRDQLSQLLLVYIGTAADIIEFFDSFKDAKIANEPVLVLLTLSIWSWSLLQFTIVLSATRARKPRGGGSQTRGASDAEDTNCCNVACCNIDVWGIALNILLQDAPFLTFRLLIIVHYKIITYMNIFFTCEHCVAPRIKPEMVTPLLCFQMFFFSNRKNTLVILLQLYRLYVVHSENRKVAATKQRSKARARVEQTSAGSLARQQKQRKVSRRKVADIGDDEPMDDGKKGKRSNRKNRSSSRKDTGYSTASSQTTAEQRRARHRKPSKSRTGIPGDDGDDPMLPPPPSPVAGTDDSDGQRQSEVSAAADQPSRRSKDSKDRKSSRHGETTKGHRKKPPPVDNDAPGEGRSDDEVCDGPSTTKHSRKRRPADPSNERFEIIHEKPSATGGRKKKTKPPASSSSSTSSTTSSASSSSGSSSGTE